MNQEHRRLLHSSARWRDRTGDLEAFINPSPLHATARRRVEGLKMLDGILRETYESEQRFSLLADAAPALIWMSDTDKLCTYVNKSWLKFTGRSMNSELGNGWTEVVHPEDLRSREDTYAQAFDRRDEFRMEYRLRRHDGEYRWFLDFGVPRFDEDRSFVGYIGIGVDVTERILAEISLTSLSGKLIEAQEQERTRIARDLHDDFSQNLALQCVDLEQLLKKLADTEPEERTRLVKMLKRTKQMAADMRVLSHQLHSSKLEYVGLVSAVSGLCKEISEKYGIGVHFTECEFPRNIPKDVALCLFRVAQEALGNVVKHSQANHAKVRLAANDYGVSLRIADEGRGFEPNGTNLRNGIGLVGMKERLRLVGGRLSIKSELMRGTEILAEVPVPA